MPGTLNESLIEGFGQLVGKSQDELETELGKLLTRNRREWLASNELSTAQPLPIVPHDEQEMGALDFLKRFGQRFLARFERQIFALVCDPNDPDYSDFKKELNRGIDYAGGALAAAMVSAFGWLPAIAGLVAAWVAKRFLAAAAETACEEWSQSILSREPQRDKGTT